MEKYLEPFLVSLFLAGVFLFFVIFLSKRFPLLRREEGRRYKPLSRFGGIAFILAFFGSVLLNADLEMTRQLFGLLVGAGLVLCVGLWDDLVPLPPIAQLFFQFLLGVLFFVFGLRAWVITNPFGDPIFLNPEVMIWPSLIVSVVWTILVMNAINFVDGVDGLLGGVSLTAFFALFVVSLRPEVNQPAVAILTMIAIGFSMAFFLFNFPPGKILAGTAGSYFVGFLIAGLSLFAGAKIATALLVLAVPVMDAIYVIVDRIQAGVSPFRGGDARHLHDKLRSLGWSDRAIVFLYTVVSAFAAWIALSFGAFGKVLFLLVFAATFLFFVSTVGKMIKRRV